MSGSKILDTIIYTAITARYDVLPSFAPEPSVRYWLFTDDMSIPAAPFWSKILLPTGDGLTPRRLSRLPKLRPHLFLPAHEVSIWLDANTRLQRPVAAFAAECVRERPLAAHRHPLRSCIYSEANTCLEDELDSAEIIDAQMNKYCVAGYPAGFGLTENRFIVRRNIAAVAQFNEFWYQEYCRGSQRDQLCFMYAVWKTGIPLAICPQSVRQTPYFVIEPHQSLLNDAASAK